jgi:hypothetical protein
MGRANAGGSDSGSCMSIPRFKTLYRFTDADNHDKHRRFCCCCRLSHWRPSHSRGASSTRSSRRRRRAGLGHQRCLTASRERLVAPTLRRSSDRSRTSRVRYDRRGRQLWNEHRLFTDSTRFRWRVVYLEHRVRSPAHRHGFPRKSVAAAYISRASIARFAITVEDVACQRIRRLSVA